MAALMADLVATSKKDRAPTACTSLELCCIIGYSHTKMVSKLRGLLMDHPELLVTYEERRNSTTPAGYHVYFLPPMALLLIVSRLTGDLGRELYKDLLYAANPDIIPTEELMKVGIRDKTRIVARKNTHMKYLVDGLDICNERMKKVIEREVEKGRERASEARKNETRGRKVSKVERVCTSPNVETD